MAQYISKQKTVEAWQFTGTIRSANALMEKPGIQANVVPLFGDPNKKTYGLKVYSRTGPKTAMSGDYVLFDRKENDYRVISEQELIQYFEPKP